MTDFEFDQNDPEIPPSESIFESTTIEDSTTVQKLNKVKPLLKPEQLRSVYCCSNLCLAKVPLVTLIKVREEFQKSPSRRQTQWLVSYISEHSDSQATNETDYMYTIHSKTVCVNAWLLAYGIERRRLQLIKKKVEEGQTIIEPANSNKRGQLSSKSMHCIAWVRNYAAMYGDKMPNDEKTRLEPSLTVVDLYKEYRQDVESGFVTQSQFYELWGKELPDIVISKDNSGFATCDTCDQIRRSLRSANSKEERLQRQQLRAEHLGRQKSERLKYYKHMMKATAAARKGQYMCIIFDGMDQAKTEIPHHGNKTKTTQGLTRVGVHLTGVIVHGEGVFGFFDCGQWSHSANLNGSILLEVLRCLKNRGQLPPVLYLQCDNAGDNKNQHMIALAALLVEMGLFQKVKINFLMVGHTHENIDQMFSCFSQRLKNRDAFLLDDLKRTFVESYTGHGEIKPEAVDVKTVYDIKEWLDGHFQPMEGHKTPHCFRIKLDSESRKAVVSYKHWSTDEQWRNAVSKDDRSMWFLQGWPNVDQIKLAPTQYHKVGQGNENGSLRASIQKCSKEYFTQEETAKWDMWLDELDDNLRGEELGDTNRPTTSFSSLKSLIDAEQGDQCPLVPSSQWRQPEDENCVPLSAMPQSLAQRMLKERGPIKPVSFGKSHSIFRCKTSRNDADANGRFQVGDMVLLDVLHHKYLNQLGKIKEMKDGKATIEWFDGMLTTKWKPYKKGKGKSASTCEEIVDISSIISDGFDLTDTGHLPGQVQIALRAYDLSKK